MSIFAYNYLMHKVKYFLIKKKNRATEQHDSDTTLRDTVEIPGKSGMLERSCEVREAKLPPLMQVTLQFVLRGGTCNFDSSF